MSKKRNQVQFTKPEDPKFLKLIKQQAGYRDGPTVDAKRAKYDSGDYDSDHSDKDEELPQVVVVNTGDLTADEAEREKQRLDLENNTKPADLSERIVFKTKDKTKSSECQSESKPITIVEQPAHKSKKARKATKDTKSKLSFAFEDGDDDSEDL